MNIQTKYFLVAVILVGSIGIWLPIGIEALVDKKITFHGIPPNITTYFVSILFAGCIDYFLGKLRELNVNGIANMFLNLMFLILISLGLIIGAVILNVLKHDFFSFILGVLGILISYRIWWIANINNPNFAANDAPLGGNANNNLANGN